MRTSDPETDAELTARCQAGDAAAFEALFRRHERLAFRTAYALVGDQALAEDVMQEAFVKSFRSIRKLHPGVAFGTWLYRALLWSARSQMRRRAPNTLSLDAAAEIASQAGDADQRITVMDALARLSADHREVIVLRYFHDLSLDQIAAVIRRPTGTVKSRISRALTELQRSPELAGHPATVTSA